MLNDSLPFGATPILDSDGLKLFWVKSRNQLNQVEAENILKASSKLFSSRTFPLKWLKEEMLKKIHFEMFKEVWEWAGIYYQGPLRNIGIKSTHIPLQIRELCSDIHYWLEHKTNLTFLEQSVQIHFRLAKIHPFPNGNGRHARLIADLYLFSLFGQRPLWPEKILFFNGNRREEYIRSLKSADRGDFSDLMNLTQQYGGENPSPAKILKESIFLRNFSPEKLLEIIHNLVQFGCNINESQDGHHPLQLAIRHNLTEIAKLLIHKGCHVHQKDRSGISPYDCAIRKENQELVSILK